MFNFWKVIQLMDEIFLAGEVVETSKQVVLTRMALLDRNNKEQGTPSQLKKTESKKLKKSSSEKEPKSPKSKEKS